MTTPVVLITGALTGIGRATALAFAQEGARLVISGRHEEEGEKLVNELGNLERKLNLFGPMFAAKTMCMDWSIRQSPGLVAWMWPSITLAPKVNLAR